MDRMKETDAQVIIDLQKENELLKGWLEELTTNASRMSGIHFGKRIDWEQRRYEIARDILAAHNANSHEANQDWSRVNMIDNAVSQANDLIKQLRNTKIPNLEIDNDV